MRTDYFYDSCGAGKIHVCRWTPECEPKAVLQIVHGIAEFVERYDNFARYMNSKGYIVVAEDHMGHGKSIGENGVLGYFHGGWFTGVADTYKLMRDTMSEFPALPYILFGHSMGSFMTRTILCDHPDSGIAAAIICGTGWQPAFALPAVIKFVEGLCKKTGEKTPSDKLQQLIFGSYNKKITSPRTKNDWLTRDNAIVDEYTAHPLCGFTPACGLLRDMMKGICHVERSDNLAKMQKQLPVFFIAGSEDPVGPYGKGVEKAAKAFKKAGMNNVSLKLYPGCRHEILNELNKQEVYDDICAWLTKQIGR